MRNPYKIITSHYITMIIGISGKIGSGKDTCASYLVQNYSFQQRSFAYNLKHVVSIITGTPLEDQFTIDGKNKHLSQFNRTIGELQQYIGTELFRNQLHTDTWVMSLMNTINPKDLVVISDVRFPNEADAIIERGGIVIRLEGDPAKIRENSNRDLTHISETALDNYPRFHTVIHNIGTVDELYMQIDGVCGRLGMDKNMSSRMYFVMHTLLSPIQYIRSFF